MHSTACVHIGFVHFFGGVFVYGNGNQVPHKFMVMILQCKNCRTHKKSTIPCVLSLTIAKQFKIHKNETNTKMGDTSSEMTETFQTTGAQIFDRDPKPTAKLFIQLRVPRREYCYFKQFTLKDVKTWWPISETGYKLTDQANLLSALRGCCNQPCREEGDYMILTEVNFLHAHVNFLKLYAWRGCAASG